MERHNNHSASHVNSKKKTRANPYSMTYSGQNMSGISSRSIHINSLINLFGQMIPMGVALFTIPKIIELLGQDHFAVLTVVWILLGYFTFFDLGLGRAVIRVLSELRGKGSSHHIPHAFWTSIYIMTIFSFVGSLVVLLTLPKGLTYFHQLSPLIVQNLTEATWLFSISIPIIILTSGVRGILESDHRFLETNLLQLLLGIFTYLCPLLIPVKYLSLYSVIAALVLGRAINFLLHILIVFFIYKDIRQPAAFHRTYIQELLKSGLWMTISNIVGPIMVYFDRFFLSALVPTAHVAFYTTPYEVVSRLLIIPSSITRVLFPAFSQTHVSDHSRNRRLYFQQVFITGLLLALPCFILFLIAPWGLQIWLGPDFSSASTPIVRILTLGILINGITWIPFTLLQSMNKADWTAQCHLFELPFYLGGLYWSIQHFGITGAAWSWTLRVSIDAVLMFLLAEIGMKKPEKSCSPT
jgi:O-antigen/teichoic acid export membrane protein